MSHPVENTKPPKSLVGRLIVFSLFGAVAFYLLTVVFGSILWDLYGAPPAPSSKALTNTERDWCLRELSGLKDELQSHANNELGRRPRTKAPYARWQTFTEGFRARLEGASGRCSSDADPEIQNTFAELANLHQVVDQAVHSLLKARVETGPGIDETVRSLETSRN